MARVVPADCVINGTPGALEAFPGPQFGHSKALSLSVQPAGRPGFVVGTIMVAEHEAEDVLLRPVQSHVQGAALVPEPPNDETAFPNAQIFGLALDSAVETAPLFVPQAEGVTGGGGGGGVADTVTDVLAEPDPPPLAATT